MIAAEKHVEGDIFLNVVVDEKGKVKNASIIKLHDEEPVCLECLSALEDAAVEAVKKWEYKPIGVAGKTVSVSSWIAFRFHVDPAPSVEILTRSEETSPKGVIGGLPTSRQDTAPPTPLHPIGSGTIMVPAGNLEDHLISKIDPVYPQMAKIAHIQGQVVLQCVVNEKGDIADVKAISGHPILIQSAIDAVKQWKYKPFLLNGNAVSVESTVTVSFHM